MKVQLFPKPARSSVFFYPHMGALTLKPSAYQARPWELTRVEIFNHYEGTGTLIFHLRGTRVIRVSQPGWMRDRIRFLYDGFRRQRLTRPHHRGTPVGWSAGVTRWLDISAGGAHTFGADPEGVHLYWLVRGFNLVGHRAGPPRRVSVDTPVAGSVFHGSFGLKPVGISEVSLPGWTTPEEEQILPGPTGGVSFFLFAGVIAQVWSPRGGFTWGGLSTPGVDHPRWRNRALFQVSPLQRLLPGW